MTRILIAGGPKVGKTTLASDLRETNLGALEPSIHHTDDLISTHEWSAASLEVSRWISEPGPWIIEGVAVPRAIRKWLIANAGKPADIVYWSQLAKVTRTPHQETMAKGCLKVWREVREELVLRGVEVRAF